MKQDELLIYGALALAGVILLTKGKVGNFAGNSLGTATGGAVSGFVEGSIESILIEPYNWAKNYKGYIPIIDDLALATVNFKNKGNPDKWFS